MDAPQVSTRTERKRLETRERLYLAASELFLEQGYASTTMTDIAERADAARRTLFNHFPSKSDITMEWARRRRVAATSKAEKHSATDAGTLDQLATYFAALADLTEQEPAATRQMMSGWVGAGGPVQDSPSLTNDLVAWIESGRQRGDLEADLDAHVAANLLHDVYLGALFRWLREPRPAPGGFAADLTAATELALRGVARS